MKVVVSTPYRRDDEVPSMRFSRDRLASIFRTISSAVMAEARAAAAKGKGETCAT
jgi:hypothetical protein